MPAWVIKICYLKHAQITVLSLMWIVAAANNGTDVMSSIDTAVDNDDEG